MNTHKILESCAAKIEYLTAETAGSLQGNEKGQKHYLMRSENVTARIGLSW